MHFDKLYLSQENIKKNIEEFSSIKWQSDTMSKSKILDIKPLENVSANYKLSNPFKNLQELIARSNFEKIIFSTDSNGRAELLLEHLNKLHLNIKTQSSFDDALSSPDKYSMIVSPFEDGVIIEDKVLFVTETDLFPEHITKSKYLSMITTLLLT